MNDKQIKDYGQTEFTRWITAAESAFTEVETEYTEAREYYESMQVPTTAPKNKEYVEENLITDLINGLTGQLIGGEVSIEIVGGGDFNTPIKELATDILQRNFFMERHVEPITNMFYTEGMGGIYTLYNPFKVSQYGIGMPVIHHLLTSEGELLLDPDSRGFMHEDDTYRIFKQSRLVEYLEKKYPHLKGKIQPSNRKNAKTSSGGEKYADLYIIEFRTTEFARVGDLKNKKLLESFSEDAKVEIEQYWEAEMVNATDLAAGSRLTGFSRFKLQPVIHTPRLKSQRLPMGMYKLVKGKQDQINTIGTVALEAVKADIKNLLVIFGATEGEKKQVEREAAKTNAVIALTSEGGKLMQMERKPISPAIMQWYEWQRKSFDEVSGRYAPERGATDVGLSGRAIGFLQQRGVVPELTKKLHLEYAFTEMVQVILECVGHKMTQQPFTLTRKNEGKETKIYYNTEYKPGMQIDEAYNRITNNIVNDLSQVDIDEMDINVNVIMDTLGREAMEMNRAMVAYNGKLIGRKDALKKLYKDEWQELLKNIEQEDMAMNILGKLMKLAPEELQRLSSQADNVDQFLGMLEKTQGPQDATKGVTSPSQVAIK